MRRIGRGALVALLAAAALSAAHSQSLRPTPISQPAATFGPFNRVDDEPVAESPKPATRAARKTASDKEPSA